MSMSISLPVVAALALATTAPPGADDSPAGHEELRAPFEAAFGAAPPLVRTVEEARHPHGSGATTYDRNVRMSLTPERLVDLDGGAYALIAAEANQNPAHVDPGAVAIAYLRKRGSAWRVTHVWPEFVWTGNNGIPADSVSLTPIAGRPFVVVSSQFTAQGESATTGWLIELGARAPRFRGTMILGGRLDEYACDRCLPYEYSGEPGPPGDPGDLLSVRYRGWRQTKSGERIPFAAKTDFFYRGETLTPAQQLDLPTVVVAAP